jgi:transcriptional regulator with XRE-family HTH domain
VTPTAEQTRPNLADELRDARRAAGLTQAELAERAGVSVTSISRIEQGYAPRRRSLVERIVRDTVADLAA